MTFVYCKDNYNHKRQLAGVEFISQFIRSAKSSMYCNTIWTHPNALGNNV